MFLLDKVACGSNYHGLFLLCLTFTQRYLLTLLLQTSINTWFHLIYRIVGTVGTVGSVTGYYLRTYVSSRLIGN